jgi:hypothetical protein
VATDILEAAARAYVRALTAAVQRARAAADGVKELTPTP